MARRGADFAAANGGAAGTMSRDIGDYPFAAAEELAEQCLQPAAVTTGARGNHYGLLAEAFRGEMKHLLLRFKGQLFFMANGPERDFLAGVYLRSAALLSETVGAGISQTPAGKVRQAAELMLRDSRQLLAAMQSFYTAMFGEQKGSRRLPEPGGGLRAKISCDLSVDQLGLILRAADESRLIRSGSLSYIFKKIVPYLSTKSREDLSWDSMRSNTYHPEERDKVIAAEAIRGLIARIEQMY
jgi:hypothetical protein